MTHPDAQRWNARYEAERENWLSQSPRRLLKQHAPLLPEGGMALDAAAGVATNGLYLAERGFHVIALDISEYGLKMAKKRARERALHLEAAVLDMGKLWLPRDYFDVVLNFHFLERAIFNIYRQALKPGGWLIFETFLQRGEIVENPDYYLEPGELRRAFQDFEIVHWYEQDLQERRRVTAQLVARKPKLSG